MQDKAKLILNEAKGLSKLWLDFKPKSDLKKQSFPD